MIDDFFYAIKENCDSNKEYAVELLKARGFLLEDDELALSDNSHPNDEKFLDNILQQEGLGSIQNGKIALSLNGKIENIFSLQYVGGGEALSNARSWQLFVQNDYAPKVPISLLEPFVARYAKAISACGVKISSSCDGNHPEKNDPVIILTPDGEPDTLWYKIICKRCLSHRFELMWSHNYDKISFTETNKWNTYLELNRAAKFLYSNRIILRHIRNEASKSITNSMARHLSNDELSNIFSDKANKLIDTCEFAIS